MKIRNVTFLILLCGFSFNLGLFAKEVVNNPEKAKKRKRWVANKIVARVNGKNLLLSDLKQPRISKSGGVFSLQEAISEEVYYQRAVHKHLAPTALDVERQVTAFKMSNNMTDMSDEEFEEQLKESGLTLASYKNQLKRVLAVEKLKRVEINEKIFVSSQEVEAFYKKNLPYWEEKFFLKRAVFTSENIGSYKNLIKNKKISWQKLGWVDKCDIDMRYKRSLKPVKGSVSKPVLSDGKHVVFLVCGHEDRKVKTLESQYAAIENKLRHKKQESFLDVLEKDLFKNAAVTFLT